MHSAPRTPHLSSNQRVFRALRPLAVLLPALLLAACGGSHGVRGVNPGPMPEGGSFHGAWLSPQYGDMHLCVTGQHVIGTYEKNERSGRITGEVDGDILWFEWEESRTYVPGNPVEVRGSGYFRLTINAEENNDNVIEGEWGMDDERTGGGPWTAVKRRRQGPDTCDGSATATTTRELSWDEEEEGDESEGDDDSAESDDDEN